MKTVKLFIVSLILLITATGFVPEPTTVKLEHKGYTAYYSKQLHYSLKVEWWDTKARLECPGSKVARKDRFAPDPLLPAETDLMEDYVGSGTDRGHMCPAADNQCSPVLQEECFYFSNMAPQYHSLNAGDWKRLEVRTRELASQYDSVMVWCGSVGAAKKIGTTSVPTKCWKVIFIKRTKTFEAYIFNNTPDKPVGLDKWKVKPADVEKLTGYRFKVK
jgi:endonuclease G